MPKQRIREDLARLQAELADSPGVDDEARALVAEISRDVEALIESAEDEAHDSESLVDRLRSAADHFEEEHPSLTAAVGRIADALASLGI